MRPARQVTMAACLMIALQACSSGPTAFMAPTANAPEGASRVDMLVVTTRKPDASRDRSPEVYLLGRGLKG